VSSVNENVETALHGLFGAAEGLKHDAEILVATVHAYEGALKSVRLHLEALAKTARTKSDGRLCAEGVKIINAVLGKR
jgi:hypothetical protein